MTRLIVSENTYQVVRDQVVARELDLIRVKGKTQPVKIFELLGRAGDGERFRSLCDRFQEGLEAYRSGQWMTAIGQFGGLLREYPEDGPTRVFVQRCWELIEEPPEEEWDGVYVMKSK